MKVGDGSTVRSSIDTMEKEVNGILFIDNGIVVLAFTALYKTAAGGVGEGWVGGAAALTAAVDLALLLLEGVAKGVRVANRGRA